jgi:hypothetical protein
LLANGRVEELEMYCDSMVENQEGREEVGLVVVLGAGMVFGVFEGLSTDWVVVDDEGGPPVTVGVGIGGGCGGKGRKGEAVDERGDVLVPEFRASRRRNSGVCLNAAFTANVHARVRSVTVEQ